MSAVGRGGAAVAPKDSGDEVDDEPTQAESAEPRSVRRWIPVAWLAAGLSLPLVIAAVALRRPHYFPVLDLAMTELRIRDVGTSHTPLIGLPGRIGPLDEQGSHPGPLSFYMLAPVYRLLGASAWAMLVSSIALNVVAIVGSLMLAFRRGGSRILVAVGAVLAALVSGYGFDLLTQPWNPYIPLLWWVVFLLAVWSVLCDDLAMLPVAVVAGSLCGQTHIPYLGLTLGVGVLVVSVLALAMGRGEPKARARTIRWLAGSAVLGVVLWVPPLLDQATNDPGNIRTTYDHFTSSSEDEPVGVGRGLELALAHLDVPQLLTHNPYSDGLLVDASTDLEDFPVGGVVTLAVWIGAAAAAVRLGERRLVRLHMVVGAGILFGIISMSRILGKEWYYLMLWAWAVTALLILAVGWTVYVAISTRLADERVRRRFSGATTGLGLFVIASCVALMVIRAPSVDPPEAHLSSTLGAVIPDTEAALNHDDRYVVLTDDAANFGSQAMGLVAELRRDGFDVGAPEKWQVPLTEHRVIKPADVTAEIHFVTGEFVDMWRQVPVAEEVAFVEPRDAEEREEFDELRRKVIDNLQADGLDELVPMVDNNLFGLGIDDRVSPEAERWADRMIVLGQPTAVFLSPPGTHL